MEETGGAGLGPNAYVALAEADLHIWVVGLKEADSVVADCQSILSDDERARAARFFQERHRHSYTLAHGTLRTLLGCYLNVPPTTIQFRLGPAGKFLADQNAVLQFNLSDSEDLTSLGFAPNCDLGVDLEFVKRMTGIGIDRPPLLQRRGVFRLTEPRRGRPHRAF